MSNEPEDQLRSWITNAILFILLWLALASLGFFVGEVFHEMDQQRQKSDRLSRGQHSQPGGILKP